MTGMPMVLADRVSKNFGSNKVLRGISLEVNPGEVLCIVGPSGSGKSTFLRCINHLERVDAGRLSVDGQLVGYRQKGDKLFELKLKEAALQRQEIGMILRSCASVAQFEEDELGGNNGAADSRFLESAVMRRVVVAQQCQVEGRVGEDSAHDFLGSPLT